MLDEQSAENLEVLPTLEGSIEQLRLFRKTLLSAKTQPPHPLYAWYPYDTLSTWDVVAPFFAKDLSHLQLAIQLRPVIDIGCGDGDLAFFLAHLGCDVTAIDYPWFNFNFMHGVRTLKERFGSAVKISESNLDANFVLPEDDYGLALFLGILYHLKNPFSALEHLAQRARYCLLSTRIAAVTPTGKPMKNEALAYLLDTREANNDPSNYWIFSETGLLRLISRASWEVRGWTTRGCGDDRSNPVSNERDQRMYLFMRSKSRSAPAKLLLTEGWWPAQPEGWCWVDKTFRLRISLVEPGEGREFELRFKIPPQIIAVSQVTLSCLANGIALEHKTYTSAGNHVYRATFPPRENSSEQIGLQFTVEHQFKDSRDSRDLGLIISCRNEVTGIDAPINFWIA